MKPASATGVSPPLSDRPLRQEASRSQRATLRRILLIGGIVSSLLYVAMNVIVPMLYEGYSVTSQTVSELSAIETPTRTLWVVLALAYTLLMIAFGWGVWLAAGESRPLRIVGGSMIAQGLIGTLWPPMHQREVLAAGGGSLTDTLHIAFTIVWGVFSIVQIVCGAVALGKRFRLFSTAILVVLLAFGILTSIDSPRMEANLPTPWIGVTERINIGAYLLWVAVLAITLLRQPRPAGEAEPN